MKLTKIATLLLAGLITFQADSAMALTKKSTGKVAVAVKKLAKKTVQKSVINQTKKLYGVKGANLQVVNISTSQRSYREKGKSHRIIGAEASRQYSQTGIASYYGGMFNGRKTANGEIFNENKFTAAHKTLALGSYALVTNLRNGRKIVVRINDRGPFSGTRILDLSKGAARELRMLQSGVAKVKVEAMQVDRQGYIVGKGAESLYQIAKRNGLPLKIKGEGKSFGFRADPTANKAKIDSLKKMNVKSMKQAVSSTSKTAQTVKVNAKTKSKPTANKPMGKVTAKVARKK